MRKWLDDISLDDLREPFKEIAESIGIENTLKLIRIFEGSEIYFPKLERLLKEKRDISIKNNFNGYNYRELARKYNLSERQIREICKVALEEKESKPLKNQISIFEIDS